MLRNHAARVIETMVDRRSLWRLGRSLYLRARADVPNDMRSNGEVLLQRQILATHAQREQLVIFDIGANVGAWTWSVLEQAQTLGVRNLDVHAFEPVPATYETLYSRVSQHPSGSVVSMVPQAVSAESGTTKMFVVERDAGTNSIYPDPLNAQHGAVTVEKISIVDYCTMRRIQTIDLLKCDAEGHDMEVIEGAAPLLMDGRIGVCQFEYNHRWIYARRYLKDVFDLTSKLPYSVGKLTPRGIEIYDAWHPELDRFFEANYVLIHDEVIPSFTTWSGHFDSYNTFFRQGDSPSNAGDRPRNGARGHAS